MSIDNENSSIVESSPAEPSNNEATMVVLSRKGILFVDGHRIRVNNQVGAILEDEAERLTPGRKKRHYLL